MTRVATNSRSVPRPQQVICLQQRDSPRESALAPLVLTRDEAAYLRAELLPRFGVAPILADGILLRSWKSGPHSGTPRLPPAVKSLVARGFLEIRQPSPGQPFRAFWTPAGLEALAAALRDRRAFNPDRYQHLAQELSTRLETKDTVPTSV